MSIKRMSQYDELGDTAIPAIVTRIANGVDPQLVWRNEAGGLTFRAGDRFVKWSPRAAGIDLTRERERLDWIASRHPAPSVLEHGEDADAQWFVTTALPGAHAVGPPWREHPAAAVRAIATGLRAIHAIPIDAFPGRWRGDSWVERTPAAIGERPPIDDLVLVHGDACAPNTLVDETGAWVGNVDFGDLAVGDRWADLAIASLSLRWNFDGEHEDAFFTAYGVERDDARIDYYRALWDLES